MSESRPTIHAVVPARAGSKGIPGKNLRGVGGFPLVAWSIAAGLRIAEPRRVLVTTDGAEIAAAATRWGAEVIERPADLATDEAPTEPTIAHALDSVGARDGDIVALLQPTSPLRRPETMAAVLAPVRSGEAQSALTVRARHDLLWRPGGVRSYESRSRRQDLPEEYAETGSIYATTVGAFRASGDRVSGPTELVVVDAWEAVDVDDEADLAVVDALASAWPPELRPPVT